MAKPAGDVTVLLHRLNDGDQDVMEPLLRATFRDLRRLAGYYMKAERRDHTLQPTALINEVYLKLVKEKTPEFESRGHFIGIAAKLMKEILRDYAAKHNADKRGGGQHPSSDDQDRIPTPEPPPEFLEIGEALERLAQLDSQQARIIELRFFDDRSVAETAAKLGISERTVKRDWAVARLWLKRELTKERVS